MVASEGGACFVAVEPAVRAAMEDVLYRFGAGQDLKDEALLRSAFANDSELDFTQPAALFGIDLQVFRGGDDITGQIIGAIAPLDTTHTVTNSRVIGFDGLSGRLFALVEAQHVRSDDRSRHLLLKNFYFVDLVIERDLWVAKRTRIQNVWWTGDPTVLFAE